MLILNEWMESIDQAEPLWWYFFNFCYSATLTISLPCVIMCTPPNLSEVETETDWQWWPFLISNSRKIIECFLFLCCYTPGGLWCWLSWVLCPLLVSQAPQHFRSETQASCNHHFAWYSSVCSVIFLDFAASRTVHPLESWKVDVAHWHMLVWDFHSAFHFLQH